MKRILLLVLILITINVLLGKGGGEPGAFLNQDLNEYWQKAWEAYQAGEYQKSADIFMEGLQYDITNGQMIYNLACCYGLMGNARLAAKFLDYSIRNGNENLDHITSDPDFDLVKENEEFIAVVDSLKRIIEKKHDPEVKEFWIATEAYNKTYLRLPDDFDPEKSYPLIIGLHGYGSKADKFIKLWNSFEEKEFIYACPETFYPFNLGKEMGYSWLTWTDDEERDRQIELKTEEYVNEVARALKEEYHVDNIYLLGFSQGCGLTYTTGIRNHELYTGLICFGGWLDTELLSDEDINSAKDLKVFIAHGNEDNMVEFDQSKQAEKKLEEMGYKVKFYEFAGGHTVQKEALLDAQAWMEF